MTELMPSLCNDCVARNQCGNDDVKMCVSYIKEVKIKCDDCKFVEDCVDYGWEGCKKFTQKASETLTNEEWFCRLQTEEKAKWLYDHYVNARAEEFYGRPEKTLYDYQKWLVDAHKGIDGTRVG